MRLANDVRLGEWRMTCAWQVELSGLTWEMWFRRLDAEQLLGIGNGIGVDKCHMCGGEVVVRI
jgi:hypothetical protein